MVPEKPTTADEYREWLRNCHNVTTLPQLAQHFKNVVPRIRDLFRESAFWNDLSANKLRDFNEEYRLAHDNYSLLSTFYAPEIAVKSFESFLDKTFRKNILENTSWPDPPHWPEDEPAWLLPNNWLTHMNDLVRTCFVVCYVDGVEFLIQRLKELCETHGLSHSSYFVAGEDGYYAAHLYVRGEFEVPRIDWDSEVLPITIELQITTQLQYLIRKMLHKHYEQRRMHYRPRDETWQWDYTSDEFATNYLGHVLHYVESMIVAVRDKQRETENETGV